MGSGDDPTTVTSAEAQEVQVRARVEQAQRPVDVERVDLERHVEALREHHLEDVAGHDVLLGHLHGPSVLLGGDRPGGRRHRRRGEGRGDRHRGDGGEAIGGERPKSLGGLSWASVRSASVQSGPIMTLSMSDDPLAPMVERGDLADDAEGGVGVPKVVGRRVGQVLDLAHHVVTQVSHHPAVQGRQVGQRRGPMLGRERARAWPAPRRRRVCGTASGPSVTISRPRPRWWPTAVRPTNE